MTAGITQKIQMLQRNSDNTDWNVQHPETECAQIVDLAAQLATKPTTTTSDLTLYVDPTNGNDSNNGLSSGSAFKTLSKSFAVIPPIIWHNVTIEVAVGTLSENAVAKFSGAGSLTINCASTSAQNNGTIVFICSCTLQINNLKDVAFSGQPQSYTLLFKNCTDANLSNVWLVGNGNPGIFAAAGSKVHMVNGDSSNCNIAINAEDGSRVTVSNTTGSANQMGLRAVGASTIGKDGTQPTGNTSEYYDTGGRIA